MSEAHLVEPDLTLRQFVQVLSSELALECRDPNPYELLVEHWGLDAVQVFRIVAIVERLAGASGCSHPSPVNLLSAVDAYDLYVDLLQARDS